MSFDQKAKTWDDDPSKVERAKLFAADIVKNIPLSHRWKSLEFGCGTGLLSYQMKDEFESVVLADSSQGMIEVLKEKIKNEKLTHFNPVLTDNLTGAFSVEWFNIIYSLMTLHHVDEIGAIFKEFASVTKPGGFLAIGDLVTEDGSFHGLSSDFDGHRGFSKEELELHLIQSGFKLINYSIFFEIQKGGNTYPLFSLIAQKIESKI